jgi:tape measure domain-containing protein
VGTSIANLNVRLTANINQFAAGMGGAGRLLNGVRAGFDRATNSAAAYEGMAKSVGELKLAGADTVASLQTTFAVARSELRKFARNQDVQVAMEIGREYLAESWLKARPFLQRVIDASRLKVAAAVVADRTQDVRGWLDRQRRQLVKPITVRVELARRAIDDQVAAVRSKLEGLKRYRAIRIMLAATNAMKLPAQAAMATLSPLRKLATKGLIVGLRATHVGVAVAVTKARAMLSGLASHGSSVASSLTSSFGQIASGAAGILAVGAGAAVTGVTGLGVYAVKLAADAEQARVSFTTMLGSADKAKQLQAEINTFAAATPFQTPELIGAAKSLLAFGVAQEQIVPTMRTLGDLSAGLNIPLGDLSEIYGKARVQGRLFAEDINQLTGRGIPVIQEFAKQFGVSEGEVRGLVESGKIGFPELQKALIGLTGEGGKFGGMMAAQSQTVSGLFSTLQDAVTLNLTQIGEVITDKLDLRGTIAGVTESITALATTAMPVIESFIGGMTQGGNAGKAAGAFVLGGAEMIATGLAYAVDYSKLLVAGFRLMQAGATYAVFGIVKAVDWIGGGLTKLLNLIPGVEVEWTNFTGQLADGLLEEADKLSAAAGEAFDQFQSGDSADRVGQFFDQVRSNADKARTATEDVGKAAEQTAMTVEKAAAAHNAKVTEDLAALQKDVGQFGLSEAQTKAAELQAMGASPEQIAQAQKLLDLKAQLEAVNATDAGDPLTTFAAKMEKLQQLYAAGKVTAEQFAAIRNTATTALNDKLADDAKGITDAVKTPLEKYGEEIARLNELMGRGLITQDTFDRAAAQAQAQVDAAGQAAAPAVFRSGTAEAQRFAYDATRGVQRLGKDELTKQQLSEAKDANRILDRIERNTKPAAAPETVDIA